MNNSLGSNSRSSKSNESVETCVKSKEGLNGRVVAFSSTGYAILLEEAVNGVSSLAPAPPLPPLLARGATREASTGFAKNDCKRGKKVKINSYIRGCV
jgi:hypothetical protein